VAEQQPKQSTVPPDTEPDTADALATAIRVAQRVADRTGYPFKGNVLQIAEQRAMHIGNLARLILERATGRVKDPPK